MQTEGTGHLKISKNPIRNQNHNLPCCCIVHYKEVLCQILAPQTQL